MTSMLDDRMRRVLDAGRWAPSGDNTQPWRFEPRGPRDLLIHGSDTRDWCVYDLEGHASQLAVGALLETLSLAASREGLDAAFALDPESPDTHPMIRASFQEAPGSPAPDPLAEAIERRCTQRRAFSRRPLRSEDRAFLEASVGPDHQVVWLEGTRGKLRMARLLFLNAKIRLTIKEAYEVHRRIIEWDADFSIDRIPDRALGLDPLALKLMRWALESWERVERMNRYLSGTLLPRIELDLVPAMACAAHFFLVSRRPVRTLDARLAAGRATQRLWLAAAVREMQFQPAVTPLIFSGYVREGIPFTTNPRARAQAARLREGLATLVGSETLDGAVFAGRVGYGPDPRSRSLRQPVERLLVSGS